MRIKIRIGLLTFGILALELALIRWTSGQVRIFAYFNNLVLVIAFLGLGIGIGIGRTGKDLLNGLFPSLLLLSVFLAFSTHLGIDQMKFPDESISLWGGEKMADSLFPAWVNIVIFLLLIINVLFVFFFAGCELGRLFFLAGADSVNAYIADLFGSLLGIGCIAVITFFNTSPPFWFLAGCLPFLMLKPNIQNSVMTIAVVLLAYFSIQGATYSPYNRIDIKPSTIPQSYEMRVNRDYHQIIVNLDEDYIAAQDESVKEALGKLIVSYNLPFAISENKSSTVIVGSGTGNDVAGAIRNGYENIIAVDIDPEIIYMGKQYHPEKPYSNAKVIIVNDDARAFFQQYDGPKFDSVIYGLLDSHAMTSSLSTLRIDNYVYTEQGIRSAWNHVEENGHLAISFSAYAGQWIADRLYWTIYKATNIKPLMLFHDVSSGVLFIVSRNNEIIRNAVQSGLPVLQPETMIEKTITTTDDWPYLYLRPAVVPWLYILILGAVILIALISIPCAYKTKSLKSDFDPCLFFMGVAFLLLETRGVTSLSLVFGSTWLVNSAIFGGILTMSLIAACVVRNYKIKNVKFWFMCLFISSILLFMFDLSYLNNLSLLSRGVIGGLVCAMPIFFAGILFPYFLSRSSNPSASLGSNLLGAVIGGSLEYTSLIFGLKDLVALALVFYMLAYMTWLKSKEIKIPQVAQTDAQG